MSIASLSRGDVLDVIAECDRSGRAAFCSWHGFRERCSYMARYRGRWYPSKALVGVAAELDADSFSGGAEHSARVLVRLGFAVFRGRERLTRADVALGKRLSLRSIVADLRLYVVRPTGSRAVEACRRHGFGALLTPLSIRNGRIVDMSQHVHPIESLPYVLDNGAWPCHQAGKAWEPGPLIRLLERFEGSEHAPGWAVLPDIVGAGTRSLDYFLAKHRGASWLRPDRFALAVQDGITPSPCCSSRGRTCAGVIFVGGSFEWKWQTVHEWAELGVELKRRVHVGRVNGLRRAQLCGELGVTSIDGSSVTMYSVNAPLMARASDGEELKRDEPRARQAIAERRFRLTLGAQW